MAPKATCHCGTCAKCKRREYMRGWSRRNMESIRRRVHRYRERNIEEIRAKDRARGYRCNDMDKQRARRELAYAVQTGQITRDPCEVCGADNAHGHHDDYSKPLDVRWLCPTHHGEVHRTF